jgi:hypothetical protein
VIFAFRALFPLGASRRQRRGLSPDQRVVSGAPRTTPALLAGRGASASLVAAGATSVGCSPGAYRATDKQRLALELGARTTARMLLRQSEGGPSTGRRHVGIRCTIAGGWSVVRLSRRAGSRTRQGTTPPRAASSCEGCSGHPDRWVVGTRKRSAARRVVKAMRVRDDAHVIPVLVLLDAFEWDGNTRRWSTRMSRSRSRFL